MPANQEEAVIDVASPNSSISITPYYIPSPSPTPSEQSISQESESEAHTTTPIYTKILIPPELTLKDYLKKFAGNEDCVNLTYVKLQVISTDVCLQHLSFFTPKLTELTLDGSVLASLRDLGCHLNNLKILRVSRCGLTSLDGMFGLQTLQEFQARNNIIEDLSPCSCLPDVKHIDLKRNRIKDIRSVSFLTLCAVLEHLELDENEELTDNPEYRGIIKSLLPKLKTLDGKDLEDEKEVIRSASKVSTSSSEDAVASTSTSSVRVLPEINTKSKKIPNVTSKRPKMLEGSFTVRFPPKVLSPRPSSGSSSDSNITSHRIELPKIQLRNGSAKDICNNDPKRRD